MLTAYAHRHWYRNAYSRLLAAKTLVRLCMVNYYWATIKKRAGEPWKDIGCMLIGIMRQYEKSMHCDPQLYYLCSRFPLLWLYLSEWGESLGKWILWLPVSEDKPMEGCLHCFGSEARPTYHGSGKMGRRLLTSRQPGRVQHKTQLSYRCSVVPASRPITSRHCYPILSLPVHKSMKLELRESSYFSPNSLSLNSVTWKARPSCINLLEGCLPSRATADVLGKAKQQK